MGVCLGDRKEEGTSPPLITHSTLTVKRNHPITETYEFGKKLGEGIYYAQI
jgi:hypothetical protein